MDSRAKKCSRLARLALAKSRPIRTSGCVGPCTMWEGESSSQLPIQLMLPLQGSGMLHSSTAMLPRRLDGQEEAE